MTAAAMHGTDGRRTMIGHVDLDRRRASGSALLSAMLILALMTVLAVGSLRTVMRDRQVAGFQKRARTALYAAEAGVARANAVIRSTPPPASGGIGALVSYAPAFPDSATPQVLGSGAYQPRFYADNGHPGIRYMGAGKKCWDGNPAGLMSDDIGGGNPIWRDVLWDVRVKGESSDGTDKVVQALVTSCHPFNP
jgi:hypothetical protein